MMFLSLFLLPLLIAADVVQNASKAQFDKLLSQNDLLLVAFTSPTLDSLSQFNEVFTKTASTVATRFVSVDCDKEMEFCKEQDVNAYPAIKLFHQPRDGEAGEIGTERYRGKRTVNAIKSFVTKWELPVMSYVPAANLAYFKSINDIVVVAYVRKDQVNLVETFGAVAKRHWKDFVFGYVTEAQAVDAEGLAMPALALYKNTDGENKVLNGPFKETDVETLLEGASSMLIGDFNERTMDQYMVRGKLSGYIFVSNENEASAVRKELTPVVRKLEKYLAFGIADAVEYAPMARSFGLSKDVFPALVVHAPHNDNVFTYKQGRKIVAPVVDDMLNTILHSKAQSGQIFGENAPEMGASNPKGHDEL